MVSETRFRAKFFGRATRPWFFFLPYSCIAAAGRYRRRRRPSPDSSVSIACISPGIVGLRRPSLARNRRPLLLSPGIGPARSRRRPPASARPVPAIGRFRSPGIGSARSRPSSLIGPVRPRSLPPCGPVRCPVFDLLCSAPAPLL
jgi:hypothetical protein